MEWPETFSPLCISNLYLAQRWIDRELAGAGARVSWEFVVVVRRLAAQVVLIWYRADLFFSPVTIVAFS